MRGPGGMDEAFVGVLAVLDTEVELERVSEKDNTGLGMACRRRVEESRALVRAAVDSGIDDV